MKDRRNLLILIGVISWCHTTNAQRQLDIQGNTSYDTVVSIKVNYPGYSDVVGLKVVSMPASGWGIGGYFVGGDKGVYASSLGGKGVYALSTIGIGVDGESTSGYGVQGTSFSNVGVLGASTNGAGLQAYSENSTGTASRGSTFDFDAIGPGMDYGSTSSRRWKRNIENIPDPLSKISALRGVYFDWDEDHGGKHDVGFIAEEIGVVLPEIVGYEENGIDAIAMDYSKMTPLLVEAANAMRKEYQEKLKAQESEINSLKEKVKELDLMKEDIAQLKDVLTNLTSQSKSIGRCNKNRGSGFFVLPKQDKQGPDRTGC